MTISELIAELDALKNQHGDVDVSVFQIIDGVDTLFGLRAVFDDISNTVVFHSDNDLTY